MNKNSLMGLFMCTIGIIFIVTGFIFCGIPLTCIYFNPIASLVLFVGIICPIIGIIKLKWKGNKKILLAIAIVVILFIFFYTYVSLSHGPHYIHSSPTINFQPDYSAGTLTVLAADPADILWEDIVVYSGNATLPSGTVKYDDVIIDCSGQVILRFDQENINLGEWDFT